MGVDTLPGSCWGLIAPQIVDQPFSRDRPVPLEQQPRQQRLQLVTRDRARFTADDHLERTEDAELDSVRVRVFCHRAILGPFQARFRPSFAPCATVGHVMSPKERSTTMRRIVLLLAIAVVTALTSAATLAYAAAPEHEWVSIDDSFTFDDCGFLVEEHDVANLHFISWFDPTGARTRQVVAAPGARITWTNVATGASVTSMNTYAVHKRDNPDGSITIAFTGIVFAIPGGGGKAYVESGRDLVVFSSGGIELLSSAGPSADLCEALRAAIG